MSMGRNKEKFKTVVSHVHIENMEKVKTID